MIRMYTNMAADLFHCGHVEFLRKARALGDYLLVGICSDDTVAAHKWRPILSMKERIVSVAGCRYVDEVIPNDPWIFDPALIEIYNIHLVVHGDDYSQEQLEYFYKVPLEMGFCGQFPIPRASPLLR